MKLFKSLVAITLLVTTLAASALAFPKYLDPQPDDLEKNHYEYPAVEDLIRDLNKIGKNYTIDPLTIEEYKELWATMLDVDQKQVDSGALSKTLQKSYAKTYRAIYDEIQLDHGFVKQVTYTDGSIHFQYQSKIDYYEFLGDKDSLFFSTIAE